jgi:hypothetical protein
VCTESPDPYCAKVPKKVCKEVESTEMVWASSQECTDSKWCKKSLLHKLANHANCHKCWPVMGWVPKPVWKTVCKEEWIKNCHSVSALFFFFLSAMKDLQQGSKHYLLKHGKHFEMDCRIDKTASARRPLFCKWPVF